MKSRCCRRRAGGKQQSTGLLHSNRFESLTVAIKKPDARMGIWFFWQRMRDSNPRKRSQSPVCYRYTNPLSCEQYYYTHKLPKVKMKFAVSEKFFSGQG